MEPHENSCTQLDLPKEMGGDFCRFILHIHRPGIVYYDGASRWENRVGFERDERRCYCHDDIDFCSRIWSVSGCLTQFCHGFLNTFMNHSFWTSCELILCAIQRRFWRLTELVDFGSPKRNFRPLTRLARRKFIFSSYATAVLFYSHLNLYPVRSLELCLRIFKNARSIPYFPPACCIRGKCPSSCAYDSLSRSLNLSNRNADRSWPFGGYLAVRRERYSHGNILYCALVWADSRSSLWSLAHPNFFFFKVFSLIFICSGSLKDQHGAGS